MTDTQETIESCVNEIDPRMDEEHKPLARFMLATALVGLNADRIAPVLKIPRRESRRLMRLMRDHEIVVGRTIHANWADEKNGGIEFICDMCVLEGLIVRVKD